MADTIKRITLIVHDADKGACDRACEQGSQIYSEPREWQVVGAQGETKHMIGVSFFDLDGYFYEVNQSVRMEPAA